MRIAVFSKDSNPLTDRPLRYVSKEHAKRMVHTGWAIPAIWPRRALLMVRDEEIGSILSSGQEQAYESLGAEKHPRIFCGGLTRTEHRPATLKPFHGARVAH